MVERGTHEVRLLAGLVVLAGLGLLAGSALAVHAQAPRAGVVVQMPDGSVTEVCVTLPEGRVTGMDLLAHAGFDVIAEVNALGSTVCAIDGSGCLYPADPCWCQCRSLGADCTYWAYHVLDDDEWRYSTLGALARVVQDGDVDGWAWGPGQEGAGAEPPVRTFDQVCGAAGEAGEATVPPGEDAPDATDEPESDAGPGMGEDDGSAGADAPAARPSVTSPLADPAPGSRVVPSARRAPPEATVEALATSLALAADHARADASQDVAAADPEGTVGSIALVDSASPPEANDPDQTAGASASGSDLTGYAAAGLLLGALAAIGWVVRRRR